jgi:5-methylcytosine-specific restriction protein A
MKLAEALRHLAVSYGKERTKHFSGSQFGNFVRHDLALLAKDNIPYGFKDLTLKASVGAGNWASVPWLAYFDPIETKSAQEGIYVVFLVNPDSQDIYLSLNQGTTAAYKEFRQVRGREVLKRRALDMRERVADISKKFSELEIDLGSEDDLPLGYEAGHCIGKRYTAESILTADLAGDLLEILTIYRRLINRGGTVPSDVMLEEAQTTDIIEARRYILSRRIERSPKVRLAVLSSKPLVCEGCGLDPKMDYSFQGKPHNTPLDVHHSTALFNLQEGESKRYRVPEDFMVLCPTCHRIIHSLGNNVDLPTLKSIIRFKHMREVGNLFDQ